MSTASVTPTSNLAAALSGDDAPHQASAPQSTAPAAPAQPSRLLSILGAVAKVGETAMAGIPNKGRASFVTGLGQGARAEQAADATQQDIKFRDFDNQVRLASLHNQDLQQQGRTQEQNDAHAKFENDQRDYDEAHGISYDTHPNDGEAVVQSLKAQTAANGFASVVPGTHLGADGKTINIPSTDADTQAGLLGKYKELAGVIPGIPAFPGMDKAQFVPARNMDIMTHALQGFGPDGSALNHDQLKSLIPALQSQRDALAKNNGTPYQLGTLDNLIGVYKANEKSHSDAEDAAQKKADAHALSMRDKQGAIDAKYKTELQDNAAANKPVKAQSTDWVPSVSADEKKKAELAENMVFNINNVASILKRRPDIVGAVAGRYTSVQQMAGSNDPDIVALGTDIHNIGMANGGIHGMRSPQQAEDYSNQVLNHFKNGPKGIYGGLKSSADSVQTFIDAARPDTYRTHSKNGGAVRAMVPQTQGQQ